MASGLNLAFVLCLINGLFIAGTMSAADGENAEVPACPPNWTQFGSRCFVFYSTPLTWTGAEQLCNSAGGHLASIHSVEENDFLRDLVERSTGHRHLVWIGGFDAVTEGTWMWSDGSSFDFTHWYLNEPNNIGVENCLEMNWGGTYWNDSQCRYARYFICSRNV